jgi:hypothetical protein
VSADQKIETANRPRGTSVVSVLSGDSYTDRALWQLSLILAEIATFRAPSAKNPVILDEEPEDGNGGDLPGE